MASWDEYFATQQATQQDPNLLAAWMQANRQSDQTPRFESPGRMEPTGSAQPLGYLEHLGNLLSQVNLKPTPQRDNLYSDNIPVDMSPPREAVLRNYTPEDYARGRHVGAESRGNKEPYYSNALPEMIPVVGGKSLFGGLSGSSRSSLADDLKGYNNPLPSPGGGHYPGYNPEAKTLPGQIPEGTAIAEQKQFTPGVEDQTGDIITGVLATMGAPGAIRAGLGVTSGLSEAAIMRALASRGISETGLKEAIPNLATKLGEKTWIGNLARGGTGITPESLRSYVGGFTRAKNIAQGAATGAGQTFRNIVEPPPTTIAQKIVGEKATKSFLPREFNEDKSSETLWGLIQRLKDVPTKGLNYVNSVANTWGPNPDTQRALYDYVVRQRNPWGG